MQRSSLSRFFSRGTVLWESHFEKRRVVVDFDFFERGLGEGALVLAVRRAFRVEYVESCVIFGARASAGVESV